MIYEEFSLEDQTEKVAEYLPDEQKIIYYMKLITNFYELIETIKHEQLHYLINWACDKCDEQADHFIMQKLGF